jgi:hypothetical protein
MKMLPLILLLGSALATPLTTRQEHFDWGTLHCPSDPNDTLPTPTYGFTQRVWMICTELIIHAPPTLVYDTLIDFQNYNRWNTFIPLVYDFPSNISVTPDDVYEGMGMTFTVANLLPTGDTTSREIVNVLVPQPRGESGYRLSAWVSDEFLDGTLSRAEHPNILTPVQGDEEGEEWTRYVSYETYYEGPLTPVIWTMKDKLQEEFEKQGLDLKAYLEGS